MCPIPDMSRDFPPFLCVLSLELCLMDRVSFEAEPVGLNPLPFPQPVQPVSGHLASRLSGAQKRPPWGKELAIQAFPEVGFLRRWPLSPFPPLLLPYIALAHSHWSFATTSAPWPSHPSRPGCLLACLSVPKGERLHWEIELRQKKGPCSACWAGSEKGFSFFLWPPLRALAVLWTSFLPFGRDSGGVAFS